MTFDEAVNLIKSNGNVELLSAINFDVNFISRVSKSEFYHSGLYENIKEITHTKTLLHVAIQCNHLSVIYFLLKRGADPTIPLTTEYQHRQQPGAENIIREESKSSANDWKVIDSSHTVITCKELAYHNEEIRALLKGVEWDIVMADKEKRRLERFKGKTVKKMNPVKGSTVSMYGFSTQSAARIKEKKWQRRVTETFFKIGQPLQEGKQSYRIYHTLKEAIRSKSDHSVCINSFCRRSFIIALTHILSEYGHMPALCFRLGERIIVF